MVPGDFQAFVVVLLAIVPGFVATFSWSRAKTSKGPTSDLRTILLSIALSALIQLVASPLTIAWLHPVREQLDHHPGRVASWAFLVVVVLPVTVGVAAGRWTSRIHRNPSSEPLSRPDGALLARGHAADRVGLALRRQPALWRVRGAHLQGRLAHRRCVCRGIDGFTSPEEHGLFLVSEWEMDEAGNIVAEIPRTGGIMVRNVADITSVRVLRGEDEWASEVAGA